MITIKHKKIEFKDKYRCIVVSDIHSHLDRFKELLAKVGYTNNDYLIINGDFVEKGTQAKETIDYLRYLQANNDKVEVILGNCEYALETLINDDNYSHELINYLNKIGKSGLVDQIVYKYKLDIKTIDPKKLQLIVRNELEDELKYLKTLPTSLETKDFLFIHAGINKKINWQDDILSTFIEKRDFQINGHCLDKYVVVGHLPTSNFHKFNINNDIIIDDEKKIICLDGGTGVKFISQLNALIIEGDNDNYQLKVDYVQPLISDIVVKNYRGINKEIHKVSWPNFKVDILKKEDEFSLCLINNQEIMVKNEFLYCKDNQWFCLDDYTDKMLCVRIDEVVKVIGIYSEYAYVIKDKEIGWIPVDCLKGS